MIDREEEEMASEWSVRAALIGAVVALLISFAHRYLF